MSTGTHLAVSFWDGGFVFLAMGLLLVVLGESERVRYRRIDDRDQPRDDWQRGADMVARRLIPVWRVFGYALLFFGLGDALWRLVR